MVCWHVTRELSFAAWHWMPAGTGSIVNVPHMHKGKINWVFTLKLAVKMGVAAVIPWISC